MSPVPLLLALLAGGADVSHRDASLFVNGALLEARFVDLDGDGRRELLLAVRPAGSARRELRLHGIGSDGVPSREAERVFPVHDDVVAWGVADVRDERGRELVLLARSGVWSMSSGSSELRGNLLPLARVDLLFDVPDPDALPYWEYVLRGDGPGRDELVVPEANGPALWARGADGVYERRVDLAASSGARALEGHAARRDGEGGLSLRSGGVSVDGGAGSLLLRKGPGPHSRLLDLDRAYPAPGLGDVDGDGRADVLVATDEELRVYLRGPDGIPARPTRVEPRPAYLADATEIELVDVDRDGDVDLFWTASKDAEGGSFATEVFTLGVLVNDGQRLLPDAPTQLLRFEAAQLRHDVTDVDGDGLPDLVVRQFEIPTALEVVTSLDFKLSLLLYPGTGEGRSGRVFERKPALKHERTYGEDSIQDAIARRTVAMDLSGDGVADVAEVDSSGRVAIRRLLRERGFFGGKSWKVDESPWKRFDARGSITSLAVDDFNGDGVGDVASRREDGLLLLLSTGGRR